MASCSKDSNFKPNNLNNNQIFAFGHGGMGIGSKYPMNSMESILKCLESGADGTEIDVQITRDGKLVLFKDAELDGQSACKGFVGTMDWDDIKNCQFTSQPHLSYNIVTVDELFKNIKNLHNFIFTFDCKLYPVGDTDEYFQKYADAIIDIVEKYKLHNNIFIESQSTAFLRLIQQKRPGLKLFIYPASFEDGLRIAKEMDLYGITISYSKITAVQMEEAHANGFFVAVWNTHSNQKNIEAIEKNPDFIQTDKVKHLVSLLKE